MLNFFSFLNAYITGNTGRHNIQALFRGCCHRYFKAYLTENRATIVSQELHLPRATTFFPMGILYILQTVRVRTFPEGWIFPEQPFF